MPASLTASRVLLGAGAVGVGAIVGAISLLRAISRSLGLEPPTEAQRQEEDEDASPVLRNLPALKGKVAFRQLGSNYPTPVHRGAMGASSGLRFMVKREDLASPFYGGNKVRTLQHQLAVCEARAEKGTCKSMIVLGTGGSNQIVATAVHASRYPALPHVTAGWMAKDLPELDNTLNMLSALSFPLERFGCWGSGGGMGGVGLQILKALLHGDVVIQMPGGNNPAGVLGQAGGALELAEQIVRGDLPAEEEDVDAIYLPVGSACTISGLVIGVALARDILKLPAFRSPSFEIVGVPIHHGFAALQRLTGLSTASWGRIMPLTVQHSVRATCAEIERLGGPGPELLDAALRIVKTQVRLVADAKIVGTYGGHSELSRETADAFEATGTVTGTGTSNSDAAGATAPPLWLCGHFCAKAFHVMLADLEAQPERRALFWQTKSQVQPRLTGDGAVDEWARFKAMPPQVKKWAADGKATSDRRQGTVDAEDGGPDGYRSIMTEIKTTGVKSQL
eukprot:g1538.t1